MTCASCVRRVERALGEGRGRRDGERQLRVGDGARHDRRRRRAARGADRGRREGRLQRAARRRRRDRDDANATTTRGARSALVHLRRRARHARRSSSRWRWTSPASTSTTTSGCTGWIILALATPIQVVLGWRYYRGAFASLRHLNPNMDVLDRARHDGGLRLQRLGRHLRQAVHDVLRRLRRRARLHHDGQVLRGALEGRGVVRDPRRCSACRRSRRASSATAPRSRCRSSALRARRRRRRPPRREASPSTASSATGTARSTSR